MEERNIILVGGEPSSGKSTLGESLAHTYHAEIERQRRQTLELVSHSVFEQLLDTKDTPYASHVSLGQYVRDVYTKQTDSYYYPTVKKHLESDDPYDLLDDLVAYGLTLEAFLHHNDSELIFLDGYPRRATQVDDIAMMAGDLGYRLRGMIVTETKDAKARCLKRDRGLGMTAVGSALNDSIPPELAVERRFHLYEQFMPETLAEVHSLGIPVEYIDTSGPKDATFMLGKKATARFLQENGAVSSD